MVRGLEKPLERSGHRRLAPTSAQRTSTCNLRRSRCPLLAFTGISSKCTNNTSTHTVENKNATSQANKSLIKMCPWENEELSIYITMQIESHLPEIYHILKGQGCVWRQGQQELKLNQAIKGGTLIQVDCSLMAKRQDLCGNHPYPTLIWDFQFQNCEDMDFWVGGSQSLIFGDGGPSQVNSRESDRFEGLQRTRQVSFSHSFMTHYSVCMRTCMCACMYV